MGKEVSIIGAGAFGTALAIAIKHAGYGVLLYGRDPASISEMHRSRTTKSIPGCHIDEDIAVTSNVSDTFSSPIIVLAVPSQELRGILQKISNSGACPHIVISSKGIEKQTYMLMSEVSKDVMPKSDVTIIGGPTFASELARREISIIGCSNPAISKYFQSDFLNVIEIEDEIALQVAGAFKNSLAILCGAYSGSKNASGLVFAAGMTDMKKFGVMIGARYNSFDHPAIIGDCFMTCSSRESRNFRYGISLSGLLACEQQSHTIEGRVTAQAILERARKVDNNASLPTIQGLCRMMTGSSSSYEVLELILRARSSADRAQDS